MHETNVFIYLSNIMFYRMNPTCSHVYNNPCFTERIQRIQIFIKRNDERYVRPRWGRMSIHVDFFYKHIIPLGLEARIKICIS